MKRLLLFCLCAALLLGCVGCGKEPAEPANSADESLPAKYAIDPNVDLFIQAFDKQTRYTLAGLTHNGDYSCTAYIDLCQLTITPTPKGLHFALTGGSTEEQRDRMLDVFYSVAQAADASCSDAQAQAAVSYLRAQTESVGNYRISNYVTVTAYVPIVNMDTVKVDCRMEFVATNYQPAE